MRTTLFFGGSTAQAREGLISLMLRVSGSHERLTVFGLTFTGALRGLTRRPPLLLFWFEGLLLLRFAARMFVALLFQLPPRSTRLTPIFARLT